MRQCFQKFLARLSNRLRRSKSIGPRGERNHRRCPCTRAHLQESSSLHEWHGSPIIPLVDRRRKLDNITPGLASVGASTAAAAPFGCCNQPISRIENVDPDGHSRDNCQASHSTW